MNVSRNVNGLFLILLLAALIESCTPSIQPSILIFSKTEGYRHASIESGIAAIKKLGEENGFQVEATENAKDFTEEKLKDYAAVVFLNTTGDVLDYTQQADFERYIQAGGGYVGIHAAADTEYDWIWYGKLVGGYFESHPNDPNVRDASLEVLDASHISTNMLPQQWDRTDEWYNYKNLNPEVNVLINLDENSYEGGTNGDHHPIAIYHDYDGGRAFYTGGGHTDASYSEDLFLAHLLGGIKYAMGENIRDYAQARFKRVPPENRFVKNVLARNLNEPMELDVFADGRIILVERKGNIKMYDTQSETMKLVTQFPVHTKFEDGLLGITLDPNYEENKWIYLFYSPVGDKPVQHVSRFTFADDSLHYATEKVVLEIPVQRDECCHSGGSLEFGPDGHLFIGVGDNTNPFASDGYAPIDERPGRTPWDGQRSAGNTNDLRGKILRITPQADGTYTIPEGNLFAEGTPNTRPEIYVMGCRNPFRISIDSRTKYLYWGDVGPDAGKDNPERGPKGIDEINQARQAGNWGWPFSRGNNQAYRDYNFATQESGPYFTPDQPINDSPNNTGLQELPATNKSVVWYSYDQSKEFPWVGVGGKNPMAGPVFYSDSYTSKDKFPDYFDGKLIAYEWMRHWMYLLSFDEDGDLIKMEPFMENNEWSRPMDMIFGKDGQLYMLEYGQKWFAQNMDARLSRIDYIRGNRSPVAKITADKTVGGAPFTVILSAADSYDFDEDKLRYEWSFGDGSPANKTTYPRHTYQKPGIYTVTLTVTDPDGQKSMARQEIQVGNDAPEITWELAGNQTFYWDNRNLDYKVKAADKEDGSTEEGSLAEEQIQVTFDYLAEGFDQTQVAQGHQMNTGGLAPLGQRLIDGSDCKNCHAKKIKVNGPSYLEIANKYSTDLNAPNYLANKIITGGNGVWGETVMSAHPQLSFEQAKEIANYILDLNGGKKVYSKFPARGNFVLKDHIDKEEKGIYILMASYTDKGNDPIDPITARSQLTLRHNRVEAESYNIASKEIEAANGTVRQTFDKNYIGFNEIDLTDIARLLVKVDLRDQSEAGGKFNIMIDGPDGTSIGTVEVQRSGEYTVNFSGVTGVHDLYFVAENKKNTGQQVGFLDWIEFQPDQSLTLR